MADAAAELDEGGAVRTLKDLFAGAAGGIAQVLLGKLLGFVLLFALCISTTSTSSHVHREWGNVAQLPCCTSSMSYS